MERRAWRCLPSSIPPPRLKSRFRLSCRTPSGLCWREMRILSGIQPSGALHIGNYFGMMKPAIELQDQGEAFYFIANYHSMTSLFDAAERRKNTLDVALDFLACGLDPKKAVFFRQSDVP